MRKVILVVALFSSLLMLGQQKEQHQKRAQKFKDMSADQIATLSTKKMALVLDLSASQQAKIQKLEVTNATYRKAAKEKRKASKEKDTTLSADARFALMNAHLDHQLSVQKQMKEILNETQYQAWKKMHRQRRHHKQQQQKKKQKRSHKNRK